VVEYLRGQSQFPMRHQALRRLLDDVYPYELSYAVLDRYSLIRRQLRPPYGLGLIGDIDTLIAATALEHDLTLVTCDGDYDRVADLKSIVIPRSEFRRS
jgi:predicted nucleic acid-binding protein